MQIKDQSPNSGNPQLFSVFAEQIPVAAALLDRDLRYLVVSRRWLIDYELHNQDIIGRYHFEIFPLLQEVGIGSGDVNFPHSPLPTPHSPLHQGSSHIC
jgi:hypothetical protein